MTEKKSNIPIFTSPSIGPKTVGIIKNTTNQKIISDPTGSNTEKQLATTVLKKVSFYVPENQNISNRVNVYPKDKYVNSSSESNTLGTKVGNKIDGVIKMGCKLTNKLDNAIRTNGKHDKLETPRFEIKVDSSKIDNKSVNNKNKYTSSNKMDIDKKYALKWDTRPSKMFIPNRNVDKDIVLNNYRVYSSNDASKRAILHSLKYTLDNSNDSDTKNDWLWDIISNRRVNNSGSLKNEYEKEDLLDGFDLFCQQMAQGAGSNLVDVLTSPNDIQVAELIKDYKGSGSDLLQQGKSLYLLPSTIANNSDNDLMPIQQDNTNELMEFFIPLGRGIWRWASSTIPIKVNKYTQTDEDVDCIILDTTLGPGFEFIYSTNSNEIYQLSFQDEMNVLDNDCEVYNLMSTISD